MYKDPLFPKGKMLLGYNGASYLDSGYIFAPYIPLTVVPTIIDARTGEVAKGIRTRYGTRMTRPEFYGTCNVINIESATRPMEPILTKQVS